MADGRVLHLLEALGKGPRGTIYRGRLEDAPEAQTCVVFHADTEDDQRLAEHAGALGSLTIPGLPVRRLFPTTSGVVALDEAVGGTPLAALLAPQTPVPLRATLQICVAVLRVLDALHGVDVAHGSVDKHHVFVDSSGDVTLVGAALYEEASPADDRAMVMSMMYGMLAGAPLPGRPADLNAAQMRRAVFRMRVALVGEHGAIADVYANAMAASEGSCGELADTLASYVGEHLADQPGPSSWALNAITEHQASGEPEPLERTMLLAPARGTALEAEADRLPPPPEPEPEPEPEPAASADPPVDDGPDEEPEPAAAERSPTPRPAATVDPDQSPEARRAWLVAALVLVGIAIGAALLGGVLFMRTPASTVQPQAVPETPAKVSPQPAAPAPAPEPEPEPEADLETAEADLETAEAEPAPAPAATRARAPRTAASRKVQSAPSRPPAGEAGTPAGASSSGDSWTEPPAAPTAPVEADLGDLWGVGSSAPTLSEDEALGEGQVSLRGDATRVRLVSGTRSYSAGTVPAGTYSVRVTYDDGVEIDGGVVEVTADGSVTLTCRFRDQLCSVR